MKCNPKDALARQYSNSIIFLSQRIKQLEDENSDLKESNKLNKLIISAVYLKDNTPEKWQKAYELQIAEQKQLNIIAQRHTQERDYYFNEVQCYPEYSH